MREKYSYYEYEIESCKDKETGDTKYVYVIFTDDIDHKNWLGTNIFRESDDWFDTEQEARFAAIGHINALESGER